MNSSLGIESRLYNFSWIHTGKQLAGILVHSCECYSIKRLVWVRLLIHLVTFSVSYIFTSRWRPVSVYLSKSLSRSSKDVLRSSQHRCFYTKAAKQKFNSMTPIFETRGKWTQEQSLIMKYVTISIHFERPPQLAFGSKQCFGLFINAVHKV